MDNNDASASSEEQFFHPPPRGLPRISHQSHEYFVKCVSTEVPVALIF